MISVRAFAGTLFVMYLLIVIIDFAFVVQHAYVHADDRRAEAAANALLCEQSPSLMRGHGELCRHDMADRHMSTLALALVTVSREATLCPHACVAVVNVVASAINSIGFVLAVAVGAAFVFAALSLRLMPSLRSAGKPLTIEDGSYAHDESYRPAARVYQLPPTQTLRCRSRSGSQ